jgi:hypothetical protein
MFVGIQQYFGAISSFISRYAQRGGAEAAITDTE